MTERKVSGEMVSEERLESFIKRCDDMSEDGQFAWWSELASILRDYLALRSSVKTEDAILPCDVGLSPATTIRAGAKLSTLIEALNVRGMAAIEAPAAEGEKRELTAVEKLAVSMTDEKIANALDEECETILQLLIYSREGEIASHVGAIKSWTGMLRGRAERMPKAHPSPAAPSEVTEEMVGALERIEADCRSTIERYARNGPSFTSPSGDEYEPTSYVIDKLNELADISRAALKGDRS